MVKTGETKIGNELKLREDFRRRFRWLTGVELCWEKFIYSVYVAHRVGSKSLAYNKTKIDFRLHLGWHTYQIYKKNYHVLQWNPHKPLKNISSPKGSNDAHFSTQSNTHPHPEWHILECNHDFTTTPLCWPSWLPVFQYLQQKSLMLAFWSRLRAIFCVWWIYFPLSHQHKCIPKSTRHPSTTSIFFYVNLDHFCIATGLLIYQIVSYQCLKVSTVLHFIQYYQH